MPNTTIIYYTNNDLNEQLFKRCQEYLKKAADGKPIVSVSHKPVELGINICIGEQKSHWLLLYKQILMGTKIANTKYVAMAEHDCFYTSEHFNWIPPDDNTFYYNENVYFAEWGGNHPDYNGMYSKWPKQRLALSQMICNRDLLEDCLTARIGLLSKDKKMVRQIIFAGEPGLSQIRLDKKTKAMLKNLDRGNAYATSGRSLYLKKYIKAQLDRETYDTFTTK
ncbi:unnamed protein product, partial [marine sediment metagenome]